MVIDTRLIALLALALTACGGSHPDAQPSNTARSEPPVAAPQDKAPPPANATSASAEDPAASQVDFSALAGLWKVAKVAVGPGVQALAKDDPAYVGRQLEITGDRLAWQGNEAEHAGASLSDICNGPVTARQTGPAAQDYDRQFGAQLAALPVTAPDPHAVECEDGQWGPEAAGGAIIFHADRDAIVMSWYDGALLQLVPAGR